MKKRVSGIMMGILLVLMILTMAACKSNQTETRQSEQETQAKNIKIEIRIFAAKSLNKVIDNLIETYGRDHENVTIIPCYDSSGTLMEQIKEGASCDIFFSAAKKQMDELEEKNLLIEGSRKNVVNNQVCVVTYPGSNTKVKGIGNLSDAKSIALADGSVPVGKYTREALVSLDIIPESSFGADVSSIPTSEISKYLGGVEINECINVGAVAAAVAEGANEVGTVYKSDLIGYDDRLEIIEIISYHLTGDVIYPIAQIDNPEASEESRKAAKDFIDYLTSDKANEVYESYGFDTNISQE